MPEFLVPSVTPSTIKKMTSSPATTAIATMAPVERPLLLPVSVLVPVVVPVTQAIFLVILDPVFSKQSTQSKAVGEHPFRHVLHADESGSTHSVMQVTVHLAVSTARFSATAAMYFSWSVGLMLLGAYFSQAGMVFLEFGVGVGVFFFLF
jgi:hypothetical protein